MKNQIILDVMQRMLKDLDNKQLEKLKTVLIKCMKD